MATIKDVAVRAGVAASTVSKYINGGNVRPEYRAAIQAAIAELGFRANPHARGLKAPIARSVGILLPDMTAPFSCSIINAFDRVMREKGFHSIISRYDADHGLERDNLRFILSTGIEALMYIPEDLSSEEFYEIAGTANTPVVQVDRMIQGVDTDAVLTNNSDSVFGAIETLLEEGHQRIAIITGPDSVMTAKERLIGYLRALNVHHIIYDDSLVISGSNSFITGYQGFFSLRELSDPPTAVFSTNYDITMGLLTAAHEQGIQIPGDMAIFGYDCVEICSMLNPPIPIVHQPEQKMGELAAEYLLQRLGGYNSDPRVTRLDCEYR